MLVNVINVHVLFRVKQRVFFFRNVQISSLCRGYVNHRASSKIALIWLISCAGVGGFVSTVDRAVNFEEKKTRIEESFLAAPRVCITRELWTRQTESKDQRISVRPQALLLLSLRLVWVFVWSCLITKTLYTQRHK